MSKEKFTQEELAYVDALNLLGSAVPHHIDDWPTTATLGALRTRAEAARRHVCCSYCLAPFAYCGPTDGEHFADLWEHLISSHQVEPWIASGVARDLWGLEVTS